MESLAEAFRWTTPAYVAIALASYTCSDISGPGYNVLILLSLTLIPDVHLYNWVGLPIILHRSSHAGKIIWWAFLRPNLAKSRKQVWWCSPRLMVLIESLIKMSLFTTKSQSNFRSTSLHSSKFTIGYCLEEAQWATTYYGNCRLIWVDTLCIN